MAWNFKKALKKLGKKVKQTLKKIHRVAQELAWRAASVFDFVGSLLNIQPTKHARLKVFVLYDKDDLKQTPVADPAIVEGWVQAAIDAFKNKLNIELHTHGGDRAKYVHLLAAPAFVHTGPPCGFGAAFKDRADWFEEHTSDTLFGYGGTMYAFVVATLDVKSKTDLNGCAFPWLHNFCLIDSPKPSSAIPPPPPKPKATTLAHEMSHLCAVFPHSSADRNLMNENRGDMDSNLNRLQKSVIRTARYVTYINARF